MQTIITRLHYWELDCDDDIVEIKVPDDVELIEFKDSLVYALGAVRHSDDFLTATDCELNKTVKEYGGSWRWLCPDWEVDVRWDEESEEEDD